MSQQMPAPHQPYPPSHSPLKYAGETPAHMAYSSAPNMAYGAQTPQHRQTMPGPQPSPSNSQTTPAPFRSFNATSDQLPHAPPPFLTDKPQIYTAVYSGVKVYEMEVNGVACMRRRVDGCLNATQILKVAGVEKGKRTKVLEKEILTGEHEKVQGGYGKYQGTWISYGRGREFCRQYGVEELLRPLLEHDRDNDGTTAGAVTQTHETPTKEQAMAANRKRVLNSSFTQPPPNPNQNGTFFSNIPMSSVALSAMTKAAQLNSSPRPLMNGQHNHSQHMHGQPGQQSMVSENGFHRDMSMDPSFSASQGNGDERPRKRMRTDGDMQMSQPSMPVDMSMASNATTEPDGSFLYHQHGLQQDRIYEGPPITLPPLPVPDTQLAEEKRNILLDLFADQSRVDYSNHPAMTQLDPEDYDLPLDASANTALHWAATLARVSLVRLLLQKGANMWRGNAAGQSALISAVLVNNCSEHSCFPLLLDLFGPLIEVRDAQGRTILHHIAVACGIKGRAPSSKYYLEALLEFLVRSANQGLSGAGPDGDMAGAISSSRGPMSLMKFLSTIVNAQDKGGNTALNLVARIGNRSIIQQLLEIRADPLLPNHKGVSARDFGVGIEGEALNTDMMSFSQSIQGSQQTSKNGERQGQMPVGEDQSQINSGTDVLEEQNQEVITSLTSMLQTNLHNHKNLLAQKIAQIDTLTAQIQELSSQQSVEQQRYSELQDRVKNREEREKKVENLSILLGSSSRATDRASPLGVADEAISSKLNLSSLPDLSTKQLRALIRAYQRNNLSLSHENDTLRSKSVDLERKYRRVISLCTGVSDDKINEMLPGLVAAVESENNASGMAAALSAHASAPSSQQHQQQAPAPSHMDDAHHQALGMGGLGVGRVREFLALVEGVNPLPATSQRAEDGPDDSATPLAQHHARTAPTPQHGISTTPGGKKPVGGRAAYPAHRRGPSAAEGGAPGMMVEAV